MSEGISGGQMSGGRVGQRPTDRRASEV